MRRFILLVVIALVAGCKSYPEKISNLKRELAGDSSIAEYRIYAPQGLNRLLALEECGRLYQLKGDWRKSALTYKDAMDYFIEYSEVRPQISASETLRNAIASTYGNDMSRDYAPIAFEQMMVHTLDISNRLALKEWDGFGINVRNLEIWRNECKKSSADNAYSLYLIGLYHEAIGDKSNALKAYRDIERMQGRTANVREAIRNLETGAKLNEGEIVVFVEDDFIPPKRERYSYKDVLLTTMVSAMPEYSQFDSLPCEDGLLVIKEGGSRVAKTQVLCDFAPLAAKALEEIMDGIVARQISRTSVKSTTQGAFAATAVGAGAVAAVAAARSDQRVAIISGAIAVAAAIGVVAVSAYIRASERADLRSWLLLPRQVQIARFKMKPGRHTLRLYKSGMHQDVQVDVKAGKISVVHCITAPNIMRSFSACLDKIK